MVVVLCVVVVVRLVVVVVRLVVVVDSGVDGDGYSVVVGTFWHVVVGGGVVIIGRRLVSTSPGWHPCSQPGGGVMIGMCVGGRSKTFGIVQLTKKQVFNSTV